LVDQHRVEGALRAAAHGQGFDIEVVEVPRSAVSLSEAVGSYLFNSQLVRLPSGEQALILPIEAKENERVHAYVETLIAGNGPIREAIYVDVRQSMQNGGGPACLRLRVVLNEAEQAAAHQGVFMDDGLYGRLVDWAERHYRDRLSAADLADPSLLTESREALQALTGILQLPDDLYR
jgi:succinylarginine dihydrolase